LLVIPHDAAGADEAEAILLAKQAPTPEADSIPSLRTFLMPLTAEQSPELYPPSLEASRVSISPDTVATVPLASSNSESATATSAGLPEMTPATFNALNASVTTRTGLLTPGYYDPFPNSAFQNLACAFGSVSTYFQNHFASINGALWPQDGGPACGSCISVRCAVPSLCPNGTQIIAQVLDTCGSCAEGDVILNPAALREVVGEVERVPVVWEQTACRNHTEGNMYLWTGPGGNSYWRQLTLSNAAQAVASVWINNEALQQGENDRWMWANNGQLLNESNPFLLTVTGMDGTTVHAELTALTSQQLNIQI
jgi:hypothetical protein